MLNNKRISKLNNHNRYNATHAKLFICMILSIFVAIFFHLGALASFLKQSLPDAKTRYSPISIEVKTDEVKIAMYRVDFWDGLIVLVGTATSTGNTTCLSRRDFSIIVGDVSYDAGERSVTRESYGMDSPGTGVFTQCLSKNESQVVLLPFVTPINNKNVYLEFENQKTQFSASLSTLYSEAQFALPTSTLTHTPTFTPTVTPTVTFTPASILTSTVETDSFSFPQPSSATSVLVYGEVRNRGVKFTLERVDFWSSLPDGKTPTNDVFIVLTGVLSVEPSPDNSHCVDGDDVRLVIGTNVYLTDNMRSANIFYQSDFPGYVLPQCVDDAPAATFFIYDVPVISERVALSFKSALLDLGNTFIDVPVTATSEGTSSGETAIAPKPAVTIEAQVVSVTVVAKKSANLRSGPSTDYPIVTTITVGQQLTVTATDGDRTWLLLDSGAWIAAFLVEIKQASGNFENLPIASGLSNATVSETTSSNSFALTDLPSLISESIADVEAILGKPSYITPFDAGDMSHYELAGENRDYTWKEYSFLAYYSTDGILQGIQIVGGLEEKSFKIKDWAKVVELVGLSGNIPPQMVAQAAVYWDKLDNYEVEIVANGIRSYSFIWTIQIWLLK